MRACVWTKSIRKRCGQELNGSPTPCSILELFWDEEAAQVLASYRLFREAAEAQDAGEAESWAGLTRVWGEAPTTSSIAQIPGSAIVDVCEIYTEEDTQVNQRTGY